MLNKLSTYLFIFMFNTNVKDSYQPTNEASDGIYGINPFPPSVPIWHRLTKISILF